ncbi:alpha-L-fucosidase [Mameliella alba]|uniref:alpha-L-fucosidase n=1 Tax=Mameliella alba TaxID=561184 RepID=A0A0B3RUE7_9RHOB|nr:alpha-L-fucosidase [Mameliella alba]KHQ51722.1 Alpha-L-fucosidase [Mameliella alba]
MNVSLEGNKNGRARTEWFTHSRLGLFIHWGIFSGSGYEGSWGIYRDEQTLDDYSRYFERFDPDLFDPKDWAKRARKAGMKYVVIMTKHHDGFCLWDSKYTEYKAPMTPGGKDVLTPIVDAFREEGLRIGFYYSLLDWNHPHFPIDPIHPLRNLPDVLQKNRNRDIKIYQQYMKDQITELLTQFGAIDYLWFDFSYSEWGELREPGKSHNDWDSAGLLDLINTLQPDCLVNDRLGLPLRGGYFPDVMTPEQYVPLSTWEANGAEVVWESCLTLGGMWAYSNRDWEQKSPGQLIRSLVDIVSQSGNMLLNVGPTARGEFSKTQKKQLKALQYWMRRHQRAIVGCGASDFSAPKDCRYTQSGNKLYLHVFSWPIGRIHLQGLGDRVVSAKFVHDDSDVKVVRYKSEDEDYWVPKVPPGTVSLEVPIKRPTKFVTVIEIMLAPD